MVKLSKVAKERGIRFFLISFADLAGAPKAKLVPAEAIDQMQETGAGFAGFAVSLDMTPADPDMWAKPDPDSLIQLPWKPEVGWLCADAWMDGAPLDNTPRVLLGKMIEKARKKGLRMKTGVEAEFIITNAAGSAASDPLDVARRPAYDQMALMRRYDVISEICGHMIALGWKPYQNDHEDANGQFEINWEYDDCLRTADKHVFFKYMVKTLAEKHGYRATFMPKPFMSQTGSGCHAHVSFWDTDGKKNLFDDPKGELGLSAMGYQVIGGVMHSSQALCAITNPTINSYKRINAPVTVSGATWSPNTVTYTGNNRTHMIRIPEGGRFEFRLADGAANPYLLQAALIAAGLDGIDSKRDPGKRLDVNMYEVGSTLKDVKKLPLNMLDAIRNLDGSAVLRSQLGDRFIDSFVKIKHREWQSFCGHLTQWEIEHTFDV